MGSGWKELYALKTVAKSKPFLKQVVFVMYLITAMKKINTTKNAIFILFYYTQIVWLEQDQSYVLTANSIVNSWY